MEDLFYKLIDKAYILPIDESCKDSLLEACDKYLEYIDLEKFESLSRCFIFGMTDKKLSSYIKQYISDNSIKIRLTKLLCRCLSQYIVVALFEDDTMDEDTKSLYSLSLMNMVVAARSKKVSFPYPDCVRAGIDIYPQYYERQATIRKPETQLLIPQILEADSFDDMESVNITDCFEEVQFYSKHYARAQFQNEIEEYQASIQNMQNPFEKAYCVAKKLSKQKWTYVIQNPIKSIKGFGLASTSKKRLSEIKRMIKDSQFYEPMDDSCFSSVVINYIDENDSYIDDEVKFSPLELAIALYYEFLLESIKES